ncbi:MAG: hypothetical protein U0670_09875 [Anaerolineae bacterium]
MRKSWLLRLQNLDQRAPLVRGGGHSVLHKAASRIFDRIHLRYRKRALL